MMAFCAGIYWHDLTLKHQNIPKRSSKASFCCQEGCPGSSCRCIVSKTQTGLGEHVFAQQALALFPIWCTISTVPWLKTLTFSLFNLRLSEATSDCSRWSPLQFRSKAWDIFEVQMCWSTASRLWAFASPAIGGTMYIFTTCYDHIGNTLQHVFRYFWDVMFQTTRFLMISWSLLRSGKWWRDLPGRASRWRYDLGKTCAAEACPAKAGYRLRLCRRIGSLILGSGSSAL